MRIYLPKEIMSRQFKIAVLLPTRGRTDALSRSVISLFNRVVNRGTVQLILAFDDDDAVGIEHFEKELQPWLDERGIDYKALTFERMGYRRLNEYVNACAAEADAEWLMFWNDDAIMETAGWDREISKHTDQFKLLAVHTHKDHPYSIFPIVPADWFALFGYLSPHQISDAWLSQQAYLLDIFERINVYVTHDRHDLTGNNSDDTFDEGGPSNMNEGNPSNPNDFHHSTWIKRRMVDTEKIAVYLKGLGISVEFWENVKINKQDPWEKLKANDVNKQMTQFQISFK
jgi:hypothetical protein